MMHRTKLSCSAAIILAALSNDISAWTPAIRSHQYRTRTVNYIPTTTSCLQSKAGTKHPGFQDCFDSDDDCLSTAYSASFVAEDWIKAMPCGKDADCLPEELSHPGTMKDSVSIIILCMCEWVYIYIIDMWKFRRINRLSFEPLNTHISLKGVEKVDVMEYLNIKKAAPVSDKKGE